MYIDENKLLNELQAADAAGDTEHAKMVANKIQEQRTAFSQSVGFENNDIVNKYGIDGTIEKLKEQGLNYDPSEKMSGLERFAAGVGRGVTDIGQGVKQLAMRGGDAVGLVEPEDVAAYDQAIQKEAKLFDDHLGKRTSGSIGRIAGNVVASAPAGLVAGKALQGVTGMNNLANAGRVATVGRMGAQGAGIGAVEGAIQPVLNGGDYWDEKAGQVGMGAAFGGGITGTIGAVKGGRELLKDGVGKTVMHHASKPKSNKLLATVFGETDETAENIAAARRLGDEGMLSPADKSGGRLAQGMEALAEANAFTADEVLTKSTIPRLDKFKKSVEDYADNMSKKKIPVDQMGQAVQQLTKNATQKLVNNRSRMGQKMYGEIDRFAKGRKIIQLNNVRQVFDEIIDDARGVMGSDIQSISRQVSAMKKSLGDGSITAKQALRQLQAWNSNSAGNIFKNIEGFGAEKFYKSKLFNALMQDMDAVPGQVGDMVREANKAWGKYSREIKGLEVSILGRTAGNEMTSDVIGMVTNQIPPEKVIDTFKRAKPSQVAVAMRYMEKFDPSLANDFKANYLRMAIDDAMMNANYAGTPSVLNPTALLNSLGIKAGRKGIEGIDKLKTILKGTKGSPQFINDLVRIARIKGDAFGRNFSGTAQQAELSSIMKSLTSVMSSLSSAGSKIAGTAGHLFGVKTVAKALTGESDKFKPTRLPFNANQVDTAAAIGAPLVNQR